MSSRLLLRFGWSLIVNDHPIHLLDDLSLTLFQSCLVLWRITQAVHQPYSGFLAYGGILDGAASRMLRRAIPKRASPHRILVLLDPVVLLLEYRSEFLLKVSLCLTIHSRGKLTITPQRYQ